jgi:uncharacterized protein YjbJ (UPF0337 family)
MSPLEVLGTWNIVRGTVKQKWSKLRDDEPQFAVGVFEEFLGRMQKRSGKTCRRLKVRFGK